MLCRLKNSKEIVVALSEDTTKLSLYAQHDEVLEASRGLKPWKESQRGRSIFGPSLLHTELKNPSSPLFAQPWHPVRGEI